MMTDSQINQLCMFLFQKHTPRVVSAGKHILVPVSTEREHVVFWQEHNVWVFRLLQEDAIFKYLGSEWSGDDGEIVRLSTPTSKRVELLSLMLNAPSPGAESVA